MGGEDRTFSAETKTANVQVLRFSRRGTSIAVLTEGNCMLFCRYPFEGGVDESLMIYRRLMEKQFGFILWENQILAV